MYNAPTMRFVNACDEDYPAGEPRGIVYSLVLEYYINFVYRLEVSFNLQTCWHAIIG